MPSTTPQLLILGNGFDLQCGLQSSYKDFFRQAMLNTATESFGLCQMQAGVSGFWEKLLLEYYKMNKTDDYNWCVVETIIKDTLRTICFGNKESDKPSLFYSLSYKAFDWVRGGRDIQTEAKISANPIEQYLFAYCYRFFYHLDVIDEASYEQKYLYPLLIHLLQELYHFESRFCKYLKDNLVNPQDAQQINTNYIIKAVNLLAKLTGFTDRQFAGLGEIISRKEKWLERRVSPVQTTGEYKTVNILSDVFSHLKYTHILSFNYTALFDLLEVDSPCLYSNVHGKLCNHSCNNDCSNSSIIFGIDDNLIHSKTEYSVLRLFSKTYRKMYDTSNPTSILPPNNIPLTIKFYGHSLSEADYSYFQSIFDYYDLYSNSKVNLIFYYSEGHEQTDAIYKLINTYGQSLSNKDQGKNLIHKLLLENRLKIEKVK